MRGGFLLAKKIDALEHAHPCVASSNLVTSFPIHEPQAAHYSGSVGDCAPFGRPQACQEALVKNSSTTLFLWAATIVSALLAVVYTGRGIFLLGLSSAHPVDLWLRWCDLRYVA